jgi:hypothetical protein
MRSNNQVVLMKRDRSFQCTHENEFGGEKRLCVVSEKKLRCLEGADGDSTTEVSEEGGNTKLAVTQWGFF